MAANSGKDNPSLVIDPAADDDSTGVRGGILSDPHHSKADLSLLRRSLRWQWGEAGDRSAVAQSVRDIHEQAVAEGNARLILSSAKTLLAIDQHTLRTLPPPKRRVEQSGEVKHTHAVVQLPAKALPAPELT